MKKYPRCGSKKFWSLSTGQMRCSICGLTKKWSKNLWQKIRISPYWKGRLIEYFCLRVPAYRLRFQVPYSKPSVLRWFRTLREFVYQDSINGFNPLSGEIEMDESIFSGRRSGKRGRRATGKCIVLASIRETGKCLFFLYHPGLRRP